VTGGFRREEKAIMEQIITRATESLECILSSGIGRAMNDYNAKTKDPEEDE
jgi:peptidyl-tRNA hydrolase